MNETLLFGVRGNLSLTVGNTTMLFKDLNNENVFIDCSLYATYSKDGRTIRNLNNRTVGKDFFELAPGVSKNKFTITADGQNPASVIPTLTVTPNWRVLV